MSTGRACWLAKRHAQETAKVKTARKSGDTAGAELHQRRAEKLAAEWERVVTGKATGETEETNG